MRVLILVVLSLSMGCTLTPGTTVLLERDPTTGEFTSAEFDRRWQAGPVEIEAEKTPDGVKFRWASDINLDPAVAAEAARMQAFAESLSSLQAITANLASVATSGVTARLPPPATKPPEDSPPGAAGVDDPASPSGDP